MFFMEEKARRISSGEKGGDREAREAWAVGYRELRSKRQPVR
jgi:hypothetical protein